MQTTTLSPVSNLATWTETYQFLDEDGEPLDISDATAITIKLRDPTSGSEVVSGSLDDEIAFVGGGTEGIITWTFSSDVMSALEPKTYEIGAIITIDDEDVQFILGRLPVLRGL